MDCGIAKHLGIVGKPSTLDLQWLNNKSSSEASEIIDLMVSGVHEGALKYKMYNVFTSGKLALPHQSFFPEDYIADKSYLSQLPLPSYDDVQPKLIISLSHDI